MTYEMLLKCIFIWENKSLTNAGDPWEIKSQTAAGDEEYAPLLECFQGGFLFRCLSRIPLGNADLY